jgi:uncharacterized membrane protein
VNKSNISEALAIGWFIAANGARTDGAYWFCTICGVIGFTMCISFAIKRGAQ